MYLHQLSYISQPALFPRSCIDTIYLLYPNKLFPLPRLQARKTPPRSPPHHPTLPRSSPPQKPSYPHPCPGFSTTPSNLLETPPETKPPISNTTTRSPPHSHIPHRAELHPHGQARGAGWVERSTVRKAGSLSLFLRLEVVEGGGGEALQEAEKESGGGDGH